WLAPLLPRALAPPEAGHRGGGGVLDHPDLLRLPANLRTDGRRTGQRHPSPRDLRLPDPHRHGIAGRGRGHLAVHAPRALHRGVGAAALSPPPRRRLGQGPPELNGYRKKVEAVGVLLHPADPLRDRDALPLLLDAHHGHPPRLRALPILARSPQRPILDASSDV